MDVHKESIRACVRRMDNQGNVQEQVRSFGTTTRELLALYDHSRLGGGRFASRLARSYSRGSRSTSLESGVRSWK